MNTNSFTFTSKETYLEYRAKWKAEYKQLSQTIRDYRFCRRYCQSKNPKHAAKYQELFKKYNINGGMSFYGLRTLSVKATNMLEQLKLAKQKAQQQYLAAKAQKETLVIA